MLLLVIEHKKKPISNNPIQKSKVIANYSGLKNSTDSKRRTFFFWSIINYPEYPVTVYWLDHDIFSFYLDIEEK